MDRGWVYIVSDNLGDVFKFGFTKDPFSRLSKYNSTECLRPVKFMSLVEYSTEKQARDIEVLIRKNLSLWIENPQLKPEISISTTKSRSIYYKIIEDSNFISKDKATLYNSIFEKSTLQSIDYEMTTKIITDKARSFGVSETQIFKSIIQHNVGYLYDDAPIRVIKEKRRKFLISIDGKDIYYDTKPKVIERFARLSTLDFELKTNCLIS